MTTIMNEGLFEKTAELLPGYDLLGDVYDFTLIKVSNKLAMILGYSEDEMVGMLAAKLFGLSPEKARDLLMEYVIDKEKGKITVPLMTKDGDRFEKVFEFVNFTYDGGAYHVSKLLEN